jgi:hypothetical protein
LVGVSGWRHFKVIQDCQLDQPAVPYALDFPLYLIQNPPYVSASAMLDAVVLLNGGAILKNAAVAGN